VGVSQQLQVLDLALYAAGHVARHQPLPIDNLQGHLLPADLVRRQLDFAKGPLAQRLHNRVLPQALARLGVAAFTLLHDRGGRDRRRDKVDGASGAGAAPARVWHGDGQLLEVLIVDGGRHGVGGSRRT
jgi:hypothetical protein